LESVHSASAFIALSRSQYQPSSSSPPELKSATTGVGEGLIVGSIVAVAVGSAVAVTLGDWDGSSAVDVSAGPQDDPTRQPNTMMLKMRILAFTTSSYREKPKKKKTISLSPSLTLFDGEDCFYM
jgi:hypothetical protein